MQSIDKERLFQYGERILFVGFFLAAFLLCGQISYSDGDDAYFYSMAHSMPFLEYLKMRYVGWEGRMTSEAMTYIAFYFGKSFWQLVNAVVLTLLPGGLIHIVKKMAGDMTARKSVFLTVIVYLAILSLGIEVIGYGAFWITGSTFYLWSIVAGIWAAMPFVDLVYRKEAGSRKSFFYAIPCGFIAAMGQEQIAAVVLAFGALAILYDFYRERRISWLHLLEEVIMVVALVLLFISPGTSARTQSEIETWMPQYGTMSLGNHIFITMQWILSSFANEGKMMFFLLWAMAVVLLWRRAGERDGADGKSSLDNRGLRMDGKSRVLMLMSGVFAVVALLPYAGITVFSEMGMGITDFNQCVSQVATPATVSGQNWLAMIWWLAAVVFTIILLWHVEEKLLDRIVDGLLVLAACASEAIMFFSPTMYASGPRVYFMTQILLWLLIGRVAGKLLQDKREFIPVLVVIGAGIVNVISEIPTVMQFL